MIIYKTPYRIPLAGGGTDIDFYYKKKGGNLISFTFNQYIYTFLSRRPLDEKILVQTTKSEFSDNISKVKHNTIKEILKYFNIKKKIQIGTFSTIPTKSGLGTSSSQMVGFINNILKLKKKRMQLKEIVKLAYKIERKIIGDDGGWQDQITATYGGIVNIKINKSGNFKVKKIRLSKNKILKFEKHFILIFTEEVRRSSKIISNQRKENKKDIINLYDKLKEKVPMMEKALKKGDVKGVGNIFNDHWRIKKKLTKSISNNYLDNLYIKLMSSNYFFGGKIIGAGGGGFFLMVCKNKNSAINFLKKEKIKYTNIKFEFNGSKEMY